MKLPAGIRLVAHRGASAYAPENTRAAYLKARELGAPDVETDLRLTSDGQVVLCHDDNLKRYGHGNVRAEDLTAEKLKSLDAGSWFDPVFSSERFYFLDELLADLGSSNGFDLELKGTSPELPKLVVHAVTAAGLLSKTTFISFHIEQLERARKASDKAVLGFIQQQVDPAQYNRCKDADVTELCLDVKRLHKNRTRLSKDHFRSIRVWGFPRDKSAAVRLATEAIQFGCSGITVDNPDWFES